MFKIPQCGVLSPATAEDHRDRDPRGLIKIFEPPDPTGIYCMGIDVSNGITNWTRDFRTANDLRTDNGAIEIIKKGKHGTPDTQVCEYAAPIEPEDLAAVANFLGRLYCGQDETEQALCIIEIYPGQGLRTQREMINRFKYYNMYIWKQQDSIVAKPTGYIGWTATPKPLAALWGRASRHIKKHQIILNSKWLLEEMSNIHMLAHMQWGEAIGKNHDDRVRALMLAIWSLHDWGVEVDLGDQPKMENTNTPNFQATDMTYDGMMEAYEEAWQEMSGD